MSQFAGRLTVVLTLLMVLARIGAAGVADTLSYASLRTNLAVPDIPALLAIGAEPSDLLRPATARDIAVGIAGLIEKNGLSLPRSMALELTPYTLFHPGPLTLSDYVANRFWYRTRLSFGIAPRDTGDGSRLGVGLRTTLVDSSELVTRKEYAVWADSMLGVLADALTEFGTEYRVNTGCGDPDSMQAYASRMLDSLYGSPTTDGVMALGRDSLRRQFGWNRTRVDAALAVVMETKDSLGHGLRVPCGNAWVSACLPLGRSGQFVCGFMARIPFRELSPLLAVSARTYFGRNKAKWVTETQFRADPGLGEKQFFLGTGAELAVYDAIWVDLRLGPEATGTSADWRWRLVTRLNVKVGTVEGLRLR